MIFTRSVNPFQGMSFPTFGSLWKHGMWPEDKKKEKKEKKDPYSKTAQEKARLEAQQRLMGIDTNKKPKKKTKKKILGVKTRFFFLGFQFCFSWNPSSNLVLQKETKGMIFHEMDRMFLSKSTRRKKWAAKKVSPIEEKCMDPMSL